MKPSDTWGRLAESLLGTASLTSADVAGEAGVELGQARRLWRALGFPPVADDEPIFTPADVQVVRAVRALLEMKSAHPDDLLQLTRVIGQSLARVADAQVTAAADRLEQSRTGAVSDRVSYSQVT